MVRLRNGNANMKKKVLACFRAVKQKEGAQSGEVGGDAHIAFISDDAEVR